MLANESSCDAKVKKDHISDLIIAIPMLSVLDLKQFYVN